MRSIILSAAKDPFFGDEKDKRRAYSALPTDVGLPSVVGSFGLTGLGMTLP